MQNNPPEESLPNISIVIPCFNEEKYIGECLSSIFELNYDLNNLEVILVDNGSSDRTIEIASQFPVKILVKKNVKVGGVRNYGVDHAKGKYIAFLDSDCVVDSDWLKNGVQHLESQPGLVVGGQYLLRDNPSWLEKYWVLPGSKEQVYLTTLVGGCIFIPKNIFQSVGGFNETLNSGEDSDLTHRLAASGFNVLITPRLSVVHLGYPSEIIPFIKRQIWHSADYITNISKSVHDKIFILTLAFIISFFLVVVQGALYSQYFFVALAVFLMLPFVLSYKRISRSRVKLTSMLDIFSIYLVDALYLIGRSIGTIVSFKLLLSRKEAKINR